MKSFRKSVAGIGWWVSRVDLLLDLVMRMCRNPVIRKLPRGRDVDRYYWQLQRIKAMSNNEKKLLIQKRLINCMCRILNEPCLYVTIKGQDELSGVTSFWEITDTALWKRIEEINFDKTVATVVLDLPVFQDSDVVEGYGIITYVIEESNLQTPIGIFQLTAAQVIDKSITPRYSSNRENSILAIKAAGIERTVKISLSENLGSQLIDFLTVNGFTEIFPDVHVSKNTETLRHCIIETLLGSDDLQLCISARSTSQLNILIHMLRDKISGVIIEGQNKLLDAAKALEREIELRLDALCPREILNASIVTDILIPGDC